MFINFKTSRALLNKYNRKVKSQHRVYDSAAFENYLYANFHYCKTLLSGTYFVEINAKLTTDSKPALLKWN